MIIGCYSLPGRDDDLDKAMRGQFFKKRGGRRRMMKRGLLSLLMFMGIFSYSLAWAEIKVFEKEVEESVSRGQSQEQVEAFALQKAKRLAVEEAGTYISSLTVVQNYQLQKDEVTALASGVVQAKVVGVPVVRVENGIVHVKVKARIDVDTAILDC
jgi:hypothetical protein